MKNDRLKVLRAWTVHFYTSLGIPIGFFALLAVFAGKAQLVFILLGLATIIDGTDGTLARRWNVLRWASRFDGRKLDDITDYINYTFIPIIFIYRFELIPRAWVPVLLFVLISSVYGFCQTQAKTDDGFFTGFPSYWNIVAFYFYFINGNPALNAVILVILGLMVFIPTKYISTKTHQFRNLSLGLTVLWLVMALYILARFDNVDIRLVYGSLFFPIYYMVTSFYLHFQAKAGKLPVFEH